MRVRHVHPEVRLLAANFTNRCHDAVPFSAHRGKKDAHANRGNPFLCGVKRYHSWPGSAMGGTGRCCLAAVRVFQSACLAHYRLGSQSTWRRRGSADAAPPSPIVLVARCAMRARHSPSGSRRNDVARVLERLPASMRSVLSDRKSANCLPLSRLPIWW
jgi:hypothetical protein